MGETILQARIRMKLRRFEDVYKKKIGTSENGTKRIKSSKGPDLGLLSLLSRYKQIIL